MTGRRVQTGLERSNKTFRHGRRRRAAGARARAEPCNYTSSLSARDTTRRGRISAAQSHGDSRAINRVVITVITLGVRMIGLAMHLAYVKFPRLMTSLGQHS